MTVMSVNKTLLLTDYISLEAQTKNCRIKQCCSYPVAELHHFRDDLLVDVGEDGVTNELHVFTSELVHIHLQAPEQA